MKTLVQKLMNYSHVLKATGSGQEMAKTKTVQKTTYMWHSVSNG